MTSLPQFKTWYRRISVGGLLTFFFLLSLTFSVWAQSDPYIASLYVALWPEYDDPRVLVIISGTLSEPQQEVVLPVPAGSELNAVAYMGEEGRLLRAQYSLQEEHGEHLLRLQVPTTRFHVEYYLDAVRQEGEETVVRVRIPLPQLEIREAVLEVQQPLNTKGFQAMPPLGPPKEGFGGLMYASRTLGSLSPGAVLEQEVRYIRLEPGLSTTPRAPVTPMPTSSEGVPTPPPPSSPSGRPWLPIGLGVVLALVLGGTAFWWMRSQGGTVRSTPPSPSPNVRGQRRKRTTHTQTQRSLKRPLPKYCPNCGHPFGPNDKYCVMCGTKRE